MRASTWKPRARPYPDDPALAETSRALQKELLTRAGAAASAGQAAETERWLANADGAGASRQELTNIRRMLQDQLIGARGNKVSDLAQSFNAALTGGRLLQPANGSAKSYLFQLIQTDAANPAVASARQGLGKAYLAELRGALARGDIAAADAWLLEAHDFHSARSSTRRRADRRGRVRTPRNAPRGGRQLAAARRIRAPKFPRPRATANEPAGWSSNSRCGRRLHGDIVVTNSSPRRTFDNAAVTAVRQWRYQPVMRDGKAVEQRAAVCASGSRKNRWKSPVQSAS